MDSHFSNIRGHHSAELISRLFKNAFEELPKEANKYYVSYERMSDVVARFSSPQSGTFNLFCEHFTSTLTYQDVREVNLADVALAAKIEHNLAIDPRIRYPYTNCRFMSRDKGLNGHNHFSPYFSLRFPLPTVTADAQAAFSTAISLLGAPIDLFYLNINNPSPTPVTLRIRKSQSGISFLPTYFGGEATWSNGRSREWSR